MRVKFGSIVVDGKGSLGGHTVQGGPSGAFMRTKVSPVNKGTTQQAPVRANFRFLAREWNNALQIERNSWHQAINLYTYADKFGTVKARSGFQLYRHLNGNLLNVGLNLNKFAPAPIQVTQIKSTYATINNSSDSMLIYNTKYINIPYSARTFVGTPSLSRGKRPRAEDFQNFYSVGSGIAHGADIYNNYVKAFRHPTPGANIYLGTFFTMASGQRSLMRYSLATFV